MSTTAAPSELGHLTILPDHSEPKPHCLAEQSSPKHLQGKPSSLRSCQRTQCISANSSGKGGMWMCSRSRAVSTRFSERQSLTLTAPCASTGNGGTHLPRYVHCFLDAGVQGLWAQSQLERGNGARHRIKEAREKRMPPLAQPCSSHEAA